MPPIELLDGAYRMRPVRTADAPALQAIVEADRDDLARWLPWAGTQDLTGMRGWVGRCLAQEAAGDGANHALVAADGAVAGVIGFHPLVHAHRQASVGYWLGSEHRGRGLMTAALRALTDIAFSVHRCHRVEVRAAVENVASRTVAVRAGFREEGVARGAELVGDRFHDLVVHGLLVTDPR